MRPDKQTKSGHDDFPIEIHGDLLFVPSHGFSDGPGLQRTSRGRFAKKPWKLGGLSPVRSHMTHVAPLGRLMCHRRQRLLGAIRRKRYSAVLAKLRMEGG